MSKTKENMPVFIMGGLLIAYGLIVKTGALLPLLKYLHVHKQMDLMVTMSLIIGVIALVGAFINSRKVAQIKKNPEVHLTTGVNDPETAESYIQIQGLVEILTDEKTKKAVWFDHLAHIFSGPDDPNYCVCKITPYRIEYQGMGMQPPEVWES